MAPPPAHHQDPSTSAALMRHNANDNNRGMAGAESATIPGSPYRNGSIGIDRNAGGNRESVKDEPVLDMSVWGSAASASSAPTAPPSLSMMPTPHYTSYRGTSNLHAHCPPPLPPPPHPLSSPGMPPLNLDANEAMKAERKRARNRVAASKCRMRKLEKIATLDQQANILRKVTFDSSFIGFGENANI